MGAPAVSAAHPAPNTHTRHARHIRFLPAATTFSSRRSVLCARANATMRQPAMTGEMKRRHIPRRRRAAARLTSVLPRHALHARVPAAAAASRRRSATRNRSVARRTLSSRHAPNAVVTAATAARADASTTHLPRHAMKCRTMSCRRRKVSAFDVFIRFSRRRRRVFAALRQPKKTSRVICLTHASSGLVNKPCCATCSSHDCNAAPKTRRRRATRVAMNLQRQKGAKGERARSRRARAASTRSFLARRRRAYSASAINANCACLSRRHVITSATRRHPSSPKNLPSTRSR